MYCFDADAADDDDDVDAVELQMPVHVDMARSWFSPPVPLVFQAHTKEVEAFLSLP